MGLLQELRKRPIIGMVAAAVLSAIAVVLVMRVLLTQDRTERLGQDVIIKCIETGDEWTMNRGMMELELARMSATKNLDPSEGLINPKTGKPTGFPFNKSEWDELIQRINQQRQAQREFKGQKNRPTGAPSKDAPQRSVPSASPGSPTRATPTSTPKPQ
jgi:hypothetical protein